MALDKNDAAFLELLRKDLRSSSTHALPMMTVNAVDSFFNGPSASSSSTHEIGVNPGERYNVNGNFDFAPVGPEPTTEDRFWNIPSQPFQLIEDIYRTTRLLSSRLSPVTAPTSAPLVVAPSLPLATKASYKKEKGKSSQACRRFPLVLPEDKERKTHQNTGKQQVWFFALQLLGDLKMKSVVAWTGVQRQFRVRDTDQFTHLWSVHNGKTSDVQWDSVCRLMRNTAANGLLMAVPSTTHKGRNAEGLFGFVIEPAHYMGKTRRELDVEIRLHCETGPLTVGSPIDSSFGYPEGTELEIMPIIQLNEEGNLIEPIPRQFITVIPSSHNPIFVEPEIAVSSCISSSSSSSTNLAIPIPPIPHLSQENLQFTHQDNIPVIPFEYYPAQYPRYSPY